MKLHLTIKNNSKNDYKSITLFDCFAPKPRFKKNYDCVGVPAGVHITVKVIDEKNNVIYKPTYFDMLTQFNIIPGVVSVESTSNNRLLDFWNLDIYGGRRAMEPGLTINKKPRPEKRIKMTNEYGDVWYEWEYKTEWNPKKWNIADTGEEFLMNNLIRVFLKLDKKSTFELCLNIKPRVNITDIIYNGPKISKK